MFGGGGKKDGGNGGNGGGPAAAAAGGADDKGRKPSTPNTAKNSGKTDPSSKQASAKPDTNTNNAGHKRENTPDGGYIEDRGNHKVKFSADGTKEWMKSDSRTVQYKDGMPSQQIKGKTVTTYNKDGSFSVQKNGVPQYTQRSKVDSRGRPIVERAYYNPTTQTTSGVRHYTVVQRGTVHYHSYVPSYQFDPWFYGYAYHSWHPYPYTWGWRYDPWFGSYNYYFAPYPTYHGPSYWLTDWVLADMLRNHHARQQQSAVTSAQQSADRAERAALSAEQLAQKAQITQEIKEEVQAQIKDAIKVQERGENLSLERSLEKEGYIFAVTEDMDVLVDQGSAESKTCSLSEGDLIKVTRKVDEEDQYARMMVVTAKRGGCKAGTPILVSVQDLQEMQNDFAERLERGLKDLKEKKESGKIDAK